MAKLKEYYPLVLFIGLILLVVLQIQFIGQMVFSFFDIFSTVITGAVLAFVLNVPVKKVEALMAKTRLPQKYQKIVSMIIVILLLVFILTAVGIVVIPTVIDTLSKLGATLTLTIDQIYDWVTDTQILPEGVFQDVLNQVKANSGTISTAVVSFLTRMTGNIGGLFSGLMSGIIAVIFMFSFVTNKAFIKRVTKRLLYALLPQKWSNKLIGIGKLSSQTYEKFLTGQIIEAFIIGALMFVVYKLFGLPYAGMTGVLTGLLSFVPYVGPFIACGLGAVFIFTVNPIQALWSIVIFQATQLVENNFIYPRVVGSSVGLPAMLTLVAATVGGSLFGILGMIFFTPIFAVLYQLIREFVVKRESEKLELNKN